MAVTLLIYCLLQCSDRHLNCPACSLTPFMWHKLEKKEPGGNLVRNFPQFSQVSVFSENLWHVVEFFSRSSYIVHPRKYGFVGFVSCAQPFRCSKLNHASVVRISTPQFLPASLESQSVILTALCRSLHIYIHSYYKRFQHFRKYKNQTYLKRTSLFMFNT